MKDVVARKEKEEAIMSAALQLHPCTTGSHVWEQIHMLEYPTPLRGMACTSSLTTNIRLSATQRRAFNACLGSAYVKYQQKFLEEEYL